MRDASNPAKPNNSKRHFMLSVFAGAGASILAGCDRLNETTWFPKVLSVGESINKGVHQFIGGTLNGAGIHRGRSLAQLSRQWKYRS